MYEYIAIVGVLCCCYSRGAITFNGKLLRVIITITKSQQNKWSSRDNQQIFGYGVLISLTSKTTINRQRTFSCLCMCLCMYVAVMSNSITQPISKICKDNQKYGHIINIFVKKIRTSYCVIIQWLILPIFMSVIFGTYSNQNVRFFQRLVKTYNWRKMNISFLCHNQMQFSHFLKLVLPIYLLLQE